jgi:peptide deformylase
MALLEIVKWPAPVLDTPADPVTEFDADLEKLVSNMFETMYAAPGVGLAAVQVGIPKRLFVMDCSVGKDPEQRIALINPEEIKTVKRDVFRSPASSPQLKEVYARSCVRRM